MHTETRTEPIEKSVVHVNVGPEVEGGAHGLASYLQTVDAGYHVLHDDKVTMQICPDNLVVWGASFMNQRGKHHCLIGGADQTAQQWHDAYSKGELTQLAQGLAADCRQYGLQPRRLSPQEVATNGVKGICGHVDVTNGYHDIAARQGITLDHYDPGPNFPWDELIHDVQMILNGTPVVHTGVTDMKPTDKVDAAVNKAGGLYVLQADGGVGAFKASFYGSYPGLKGQQPLIMGKNHAVSMLLTPSEKGYWLLLRNGSVYSFGDATYHGVFASQVSPTAGALKLIHDGPSYKAVREDGASLSPKK